MGLRGERGEGYQTPCVLSHCGPSCKTSLGYLQRIPPPVPCHPSTPSMPSPEMHKATTWVSLIFSAYPSHPPDFSPGLENFYPPTRVCLPADCPRRKQTGYPTALVFQNQYFAGLYTLGEGMVPVIVSSLPS
ncbi:hypothetical protein CALVIDRAFT_33973 [Calocera viscosa TUFC12733]|uniref:Uncharacterized protein n=1 Tax=Calocera viscosa (strain TUFC12733) TaxID=1330018 RepID=A0A167FPF5_CALVF|nr:hypothetical protein CALVIDRAFT_33973 [Calocera viscosa TUFC12733]